MYNHLFIKTIMSAVVWITRANRKRKTTCLHYGKKAILHANI